MIDILICYLIWELYIAYPVASSHKKSSKSSELVATADCLALKELLSNEHVKGVYKWLP